MMNKIIKKSIYLFFVSIILISCNKKQSLQRYYVDNQESKNFVTQDLPLSMLDIEKSKLTETQKEAYNSVSKLNFLGYKYKESNATVFNSELLKIKTILSNKKYNDLMEFSNKGDKVVVKYIGDNDLADEVIVFGSSKKLGFGIIRILGNDMDPEKMMTLLSILQKTNIEEGQVKEIINFFK